MENIIHTIPPLHHSIHYCSLLVEKLCSREHRKTCQLSNHPDIIQSQGPFEIYNVSYRRALYINLQGDKGHYH